MTYEPKGIEATYLAQTKYENEIQFLENELKKAKTEIESLQNQLIGYRNKSRTLAGIPPAKTDT